MCTLFCELNGNAVGMEVMQVKVNGENRKKMSKR